MNTMPPSSTPTEPATPTPEQRLATSRECMRMALDARMAEPHASHSHWPKTLLAAALAPCPDGTPDTSGVTQTLLGSLLRSWWQAQPLRQVAVLTEVAANDLLRPTAQRHPLTLVLGAALAGGVLVRARPWRWSPVRHALAGVLPALWRWQQRPPP